MVYTWTDSAGVKHFTNKEYEIPASYRARVKSLYPETGDTEAQRQKTPSVPEKPADQSSTPVQQPKPEGPAAVSQPAVLPKPKDLTPERPTKRGRRRGPTEEE